MLKIKWTDRKKNGEVLQRAKEERLLLKIIQNRRHSWIGHTFRHNEFVVNIFEGAIFGKVFQQHRDAICHQVLFPAREGAEGNLRHSDRNIGLFPSWSG